MNSASQKYSADSVERGIVLGSYALFINLEMIAFMIGLTPLALFLQRPLFILACLIAVALASLTWMLKGEPVPTSPPSSSEMLLAAEATVTHSAIWGVISLVFYGIVYGLLYAVVIVGSLVGWNWGVNAEPIAFYAAAALLILQLVGIAPDSMRTTAEQLFPKGIAATSTFRALAARRPRAGIVMAVVVSLLFAMSITSFILDDNWRWLQVFLQFALVIAGIEALPPDIETPERETRADVREAIRSLFAGLGFRIEQAPKTGKHDVDPFFADVDFVASKPGLQLLVQVQLPSRASISTNWRSISGLQAACFVFARQEELAEAPRIEPLLVIVDSSPDEAILKSARNSDVRIFRLTTSEIKAIDNADAAKEVAARLSGVLKQTLQTQGTD